MPFNESIVEEAALTCFEQLGYAVGHGPRIAPCEPVAEPDGFVEVVLVSRRRLALRLLRAAILDGAREVAFRKFLWFLMASRVPMGWNLRGPVSKRFCEDWSWVGFADRMEPCV